MNTTSPARELVLTNELYRRFADQGWKPWALRLHPDFPGQHIEVVSYPWPENGKVYVNVRTVIGDPTSMVTLELR